MKKVSLIIVLLSVALVMACTTPTPTVTTEPPTATTESPIVTPTPDTSPIATPVTVTLALTDTVATNRAESAGFDKLESESMEETNMSGTILELLTAAAFLSLVANRLVQGIATPIFDRLKLDKFWLMYISWVVGGLLVGASGVNLFVAIPGISMPPVLGLVLSALVAGGGSNLMHELFGALGQGRVK